MPQHYERRSGSQGSCWRPAAPSPAACPHSPWPPTPQGLSLSLSAIPPPPPPLTPRTSAASAKVSLKMPDIGCLQHSHTHELVCLCVWCVWCVGETKKSKLVRIHRCRMGRILTRLTAHFASHGTSSPVFRCMRNKRQLPDFMSSSNSGPFSSQHRRALKRKDTNLIKRLELLSDLFM